MFSSGNKKLQPRIPLHLSLALSLILSIVSVISGAPAANAATSFPCGNSGTYEVTSGVLTGNTSCAGNLTISNTVTAIGASAFSGNINLGAVVVPASVVTIGSQAFYTAKFTSITFSEGLRTISDSYAFGGVVNSKKLDLYLPNSLTSIGNNAFAQSNYASVSIGENITSLGQAAFYNNDFATGFSSIVFRGNPPLTTLNAATALGYIGTEITLPSNLTTIGVRGLDGEKRIQFLEVPSKVTSVGDQGFNYMDKLQTIVLPNSLTTMGLNLFTGSPLVDSVIYCGTNSAVLNYVYPNSVHPSCKKAAVFNGNGASSGAMTSQLADVATNLKANSYLRSGFAFTGWNTKADGSGTSYAAGASFPFTSNIQLYAQWSVTLSNFPSLSKTFGASQFTLTAPTLAVAIGGTFSYTTSDSAVASISGSRVTIVAGGTATVTAIFTPTDSVNYRTSSISALFTVQAATQSISALSSRLTMSAGETSTLTSSGSLGTGAISYVVTSGNCSIVGETLTATGSSGNCLVTATIAADSRYSSATSSPVTIALGKLSPVLSRFSIPTQIYGASPITLVEPLVSGSIPGTFTYSSETTTVATINGSTLTVLSGGSSTITATFTPTNTALYNVVTIQALLNVSSTSQVISVTSTVPRIASVNASNYRPTATALGGAVVIALDRTSSGCTLISGVISFVATGTCLINYNQSGNANYSIAPQVQESISIGKGAARLPSLGATTRTADGFTVEITNYDSGFTWSGVNTMGSAVTIARIDTTSALVTISGLGRDIGSSVTISAQRSEYDDGSSTTSTIFSLGLAGAPTSLAATAYSESVSLTWIAPTSNGGSTISNFSIQYSSDSGATWRSFTHVATSNTSITVTGLSNGTLYAFQVAAISAAGTSPFSTIAAATPLGTPLLPTLDAPIPTADGFTINVTNYDALFRWDSSTVTVGDGNLTRGVATGSILPLRITGMSPGSSSSITVTASKSNYSLGSTVASGSSLNARLIPIISEIIVSTDGLTAKVSNYSSEYVWTASTPMGLIEISSVGIITMINALPQSTVTFTISNSRSGYAAGSESTTATTLPLLRISYDGKGHSGGAVPSDLNQYKSSETATVLGNTGNLTKSGYSFSGWNLNPSNTGETYGAASIYPLSTSSVTFYAKWRPNPYSVNYQSAFITGGSAPLDQNISGSQNFYIIGDSAPILGNTGNLSRTGYTFIGWTDNSAGTGTVYISGDSYRVGTSNINLWAKWSPLTYTVTYNKNGASGNPSKFSDSYTTGNPAIMVANSGTMAKTGYSFLGWSTTTMGALIAETFTVSSNTTLYAKWFLASYSVTYLLDGGTGTPPTQLAVNYLEAFTVAASTGLSKTVGSDSYAFVAWSDGKSTYNPSVSYRMEASAVVLTALWTKIYNVNYTFNGGTSRTQIPDEQKILGDSVTVTSVIPSRSGYTFLNWIDQSGRFSAAGDSYTVDDGHYSLRANWSAISYKVRYDSAGGSTSPTESDKNIGESFQIGAAPTLEGYSFSGWSDGVSIYPAGANYLTQADDVIFTAYWEPDTYQITFDFNGGVGTSIPTLSYIYGTPAATLPASGPTRLDYNFGGWSTSAFGRSVGSTFSPSGSIILRAVWTPSVYHLTFNAGLGFSDWSTAKVTIASSLILPNATRANYTLLGWSSQSSGGTIYPAGTSFTPTSDGDLFAQWTLEVFLLTYNANHGSSSEPSGSMVYGATSGITLASATRPNYVFEGWYSSAEGGYLIGGANTSYIPTTSLTVYAHWTQASLYGMGPATKIAEVTVSAGNGYNFTAGSSGSTVAISYIADSLLPGTKISAYIQDSTSRAASVMDPSFSYILSMVLAWVAPDGTVPNTAAGKPITMTISNQSIKSGAKVYRLLGQTPTYLGTALVDGVVSVAITEDPEIVIAITTPEAPTEVVGSAPDLTSVLVSWSAPSGTGGSEITGYTATSNAGQSCTTATNSCRITGLTAATSYRFEVTASNARGTSAASLLSLPISTSNPASSGSSSQGDSSAGSSAEAAAIVLAAEVAAAKVIAEQEAVLLAAKIASEKLANEASAAKVIADQKAAEEARIAEESKLAKLKALAEGKALADAALAAKKIIPTVTLYSIRPSLKLSDFDTAYLKKYVSTLKKDAVVTCIGYIYGINSNSKNAKQLAQNQAKAVCALMKKTRSTLKTSIKILPAKSAPKAAVGAKWVSVSYRIDGYLKN